MKHCKKMEKTTGILTQLLSPLLAALLLINPVAAISATDNHASKEGEHKEGAELRLEPLRARGVVTGKVQRKPLNEALRATAEIVYNETRRSVVTARSSGVTEKVTVFAHQRVRKNQLLAEIYSPEFLSAQQEYLLIHNRAQREAAAQGLQDNRALLADAEQRLRILGLTDGEIRQLATTTKPFQYLHIHSPIAGTVIEHKINAGDAVQTGQTLYIISDLSTVWARIALPERSLSQVQPGQPVSLAVKAYPERRFTGKILSIGADMDETTRTLKARALIQNPGDILKPGMFAETEITTDGKESMLAVPTTALIQLKGQTTVFKVEGDELHPQPVETGNTHGDWTHIRTGLAAGEEVVVQGAFLVKSLLLKSEMGEGHAH